MTIYNNLPVYKTSYDLLLQVFEVVKNFTKEYKYTLGDKIKNEIIALITSIYRANNSFEKRLENIRQAREQIEVLRLYIRIIKDLKLVKLEKFADLNENIESLSKQLLAWENSLKNKKETKFL
ncbi:MAG: four helix bundle protein [Candidatus Gracilibacteria bacterium]|jgi:uncharacterized protein YpuA (DUF1002 family)